jgi:hypothetical protein
MIAAISIVVAGVAVYYGTPGIQAPNLTMEAPALATTEIRTRPLGWELDASVEDLIAVLEDKNEEIHLRRAAATYLGERGDPKAVTSLISALKDGDWFVRRNAAQALGKIRDPRATEPLIDVTQDRNERLVVRAEAAVSLAKIGGFKAESAANLFAEEINLQKVLQDYNSYLTRAREDVFNESGSVTLLVLILETHDDAYETACTEHGDCQTFLKVVEDMLNSDSLRLREEVEEWAEEHGYTICVVGHTCVP